MPYMRDVPCNHVNIQQHMLPDIFPSLCHSTAEAMPPSWRIHPAQVGTHHGRVTPNKPTPQALQ